MNIKDKESEIENKIEKEKNEIIIDNKEINIDEIWEKNSKFKLNYTKILDSIKKRSNFTTSSNEYLCNVLLMPQKIELSDKISSLNLLSAFYKKNRRNNLLYSIVNKFDKCLDDLLSMEPALVVNVFIKAIESLSEENNYIYAYKYLQKTQKIIDKNSFVIKKKYNLDSFVIFNEEIKAAYLKNTIIYRKNFSDNESIKNEDIQNIKKIFDSLIEGKYEINSKEFIFVINKKWVMKSNIFIDNYMKAKEGDINRFYEESFDPDYIYESYFNIKNNDTKNIKKQKNYSAFPGPINNFEITAFKDYWKDSINLDENYFLKKDIKLGEDYYLINEKDWKLLSEIFGATNEIKRRKDNLELIPLKFILFDNRINSDNNNINLLKQKYILINKNSSMKQFREKIIRITNDTFKQKIILKPKDVKIKKEEEEVSKNEEKSNKNVKSDDKGNTKDKIDKKKDEKEEEIKKEENKEEIKKEENKEENKEEIKKDNYKNENKEKEVNIINLENNKKKYISFYILDKNKKELLIEMTFSVVISNSEYDSLFINEITEEKINETKSLTDLLDIYKKEKHILIIEIYEDNEKKFLFDLKEFMKNKYECRLCSKLIPNLKQRFKCEICNLSLFCSRKCASESSEHTRLDNQLFRIYDKKFVLSELLSINLDVILSEMSEHGRVGLLNMGNTCYMNSALQCLSNTEDLTKYFLLKSFKSEINNGSSLSSKGFISKSYYNLINSLWNSPGKQFLPREFRETFCHKTQLFMTGEQQDSQEFLLALLDNLHEDLNRITNKKYLELQEQQNGESDLEASARWWNYHKSRENSIIVDLFHGQFKSTIKCCVCNNSSTSYDTYMSLGIPIPTQKTQFQVKLLTEDLNFIDLSFKLRDDICIKDIINKATTFLNKEKYKKYLMTNNKENDKDIEIPQKLLYNNIEVLEFNDTFKITNIYNTSYENKNNINQPLIDNLKLNNIYSKNYTSELILYEKNINSDSKDNINIYIYPLTTIKKEGFISTSNKDILLSYPIIFSVKKNTSIKDLNSSIFQKFKPFLKLGDIKQESFEICYPHFNKDWGKLKKADNICILCQEKNDSKKYCLLNNKNMLISDLINLQKIQNQNSLILFAKSQAYKKNIEFYSGIPLFTYKSSADIKNSRTNLNIYDSIDLFNKEENLEGDNQWYCKKCKQHRNAQKKIEIFKTPLYLIVQLKRFKHRNNNIIKFLLGSKNSTFVDYKEILNLKEFVVGPDKDKSIYNLYAITIHKEFMNGGHYIAYCKNKGIWCVFDDEKITRCENPISKDAYLLFYKRKYI